MGFDVEAILAPQVVFCRFGDGLDHRATQLYHGCLPCIVGAGYIEVVAVINAIAHKVVHDVTLERLCWKMMFLDLQFGCFAEYSFKSTTFTVRRTHHMYNRAY